VSSWVCILVVFERGEAAGIHLARVVHQDVDAAELLLGGLDHPGDVGFFRHVGGYGVHFAAGALGQIFPRLHQFLFVAAGDQDAHTFFEKLARGFEADAARAAGDDRAAAFDAQIHPCSPVGLTPRGLAGSIPGNAAAG